MSDFCNEIEKFGKGIGNASRFKIVQELFSGPKTVSQLVNAVDQSQPAVSQHLKTLKTANLVNCERQGQEILYTLNASYVLKMLQTLSTEVKKRKQSH